MTGDGGPLPGLARHRIARLTVLDFGLFRVNAGRIIGIPGFLLETDLGAHLLIDTGFPEAYATDPAIAARDGLPAFGALIGYGAENTLTGQLAGLGLSPRDIDATILTHSHIDHVGGLARLAHAPVILTRRERAEPRPLYFGAARPLEWPAADYRLIEAETEVCGGLRLLPTPGHTPGHLSALVTLPETGPLILAADAINRESEPAEGFPDATDPAAARASADRLFALRERLSARLIYGHDPQQWADLRKAPLVYG